MPTSSLTRHRGITVPISELRAGDVVQILDTQLLGAPTASALRVRIVNSGGLCRASITLVQGR